MDILYISSVVSNQEFENMNSKLKPSKGYTSYGMQQAGNKFHNLLMKGLASENQISALSGRPISSHLYEGRYWKSKKENIDNIQYEYVGVFNIPIIKQLGMAVTIFRKTLKWLKQHKNSKQKAIVFDGAFVSAIPSIILASKLKHTKSFAIVADVYSYMADVKPINVKKDNFLIKLIKKIIAKCYQSVNGFILLTEEMNQLINKKGSPHIVVEGFSDKNMEKIKKDYSKLDDKHIILYAGALKKEYGLDILINGFLQYKDQNAELWIFGDGTYITQLEESCQKDNRIQFFGVASNEVVVRKELEATLLVNPRPTKDEFTRYSFPSKTMEYMASGTPVLTTKLSGMPKEYYPYVFLIEQETSEGMAFKLKEIFSLTKEELNQKGKNAREFILKEKNNILQGRKVSKFIFDVVQGEKDDKN